VRHCIGRSQIDGRQQFADDLPQIFMRDRMYITGDISALQAMLLQYGFVERQWWHSENGNLILHVASSDRTWSTPQIQSLSQSAAAIAERHVSYLNHIPSIANAHAHADSIHRATAMDIEPDPDPPSGTVSDQTSTSILDVDYSSDEEWLPTD